MGDRLTHRGSFLSCHLRALAFASAILVVKGCCNTSSSSDSSEGCGPLYDSDAGTGGTWGTGAYPSGGSGALGGSGGSAAHGPLPEDWTLVDDWPDCPFLIAPKPPSLVLDSVACSELAPPGHECSRLILSLDGFPGGLTPWAAMSFEPDSELPLIHLQFDQQRDDETIRFSLIATEGRGTVRHAMAQIVSTNCDFGPPLLETNNYAIALARGIGAGVSGRRDEGIVVGSVDGAITRPPFSVAADDSKSSTWLLTPSWVVRNASTVVARTRDWNAAVTVYDPTDLPDRPWGAAVAGAGNALFLEIASPSQTSVWAWSPEAGRTLLLAGDDFATDGTDMVWTQASGEVADGGEGSHTLMKAPLSTDAVQVQSTMQTVTDLGPLGYGRWAVGCGRAARVSFVADDVDPSIVVVDLSDGAMEVTPSVHGATESVEWTRVVGLTCSSLYVLGQQSEKTNLWKLSVQGNVVDAGLDAQADVSLEAGVDAAPDVSLDAGDDADAQDAGTE